MKIIVVIPTYNEKENITKIIKVLSDVFKKIQNHECLLLVVDGNSPDGTGDAVKELIYQYPFVNLLIEEKKAGLGAAYVYGFKHGMEMGADVLIEMDADFQHDPWDLPRMISEIDNGYDYVIGSRYVRGGTIPKEWSFYRKFLSVGGTWFSKIVLGIFTVNDFTSGFKASRVKGFVDQMDLSNLLTKGFAYKIELLYRMHKLGAKIKEIPISFGTRIEGESKMQESNPIDSLRVVVTLRIRESIHLFRFLMVGTIGFVSDMVLSNLFALTDLRKGLSASLAALIAMLVTFILNNFWSFKERKIEGFGPKIKLFIMYVLGSSVPIVLRNFFVDFVIAKMGYSFVVYNLSILICIFLGLIWNFTIYSKIIWKDKSKF